MNLIETIRSIPNNYKDRKLTSDSKSSTDRMSKRLQELSDIWELEIRGKAAGLGIASGALFIKSAYETGSITSAVIGGIALGVSTLLTARHIQESYYE